MNAQRIVLVLVILLSILPLGLSQVTYSVSSSAREYQLINGRHQFVEVGRMEDVACLSLFGIEILHKTGIDALTSDHEKVTKYKYLYSILILVFGIGCSRFFKP
ncbi:MAG: hypothetical protein P9L90_04720 [Candidatus Aadella gelida]|nr:hypothetical protein [Candidatus Aadella gelida]